jgi:catechol 2,3-dioxygenase-like lactoylglutathione lyase family enzyme
MCENRFTEDMTMNQIISAISLLVRDYDEAIYFYTGKPSFHLLKDAVIGIEELTCTDAVIDYDIHLTRGKIKQIDLPIHEGRSFQDNNRKQLH